jgi:hypothetical protein
MLTMTRFCALIPLLCMPFTAAHADVTVTFSEGAPTDRFTLAADDACLDGPLAVIFDLSGSSAGLIFDITSKGAGVEVYQPFVLISGAEDVKAHSDVSDGDVKLNLELAALMPDRPIAFTTDLDDTIGQREITVSGAEIAGATVSITSRGETVTSVFGPDAIATIATSDCIS